MPRSRCLGDFGGNTRIARRRLIRAGINLRHYLEGIEGREIAALGARGTADANALHEGFVKRGKNNATAEAICEAVGRPTMRFVGLKSAEQQNVLMLHRTRKSGGSAHNAGRCDPPAYG